MPRHEDLRAAVLAASARLIADRGPAALSLREIAREAGVSHQAPYRHFADRDAVVAALAEDGFRALAEHLRVARGAGDLPEALEASARAYLSFALAHPGHYRVMFRPDLLPEARSESAQAAAADAFAELAWMAAWIVDQGAFPGDEEVATAWLWSLVHGLAVLMLDGPLPMRGSKRSKLELADAVAVACRQVLGAAPAAPAPPAAPEAW
jgi:AcrR family transcriptional regulator